MTTQKNNEYFIGLDLGTNSVGWAVTDSEYNILRAKGKTLWGSRLFDEAKTAADRRLHRSVRRRLARENSRIKLLRELMKPEIAAVDPDFYCRLDESFYVLEDKKGLREPSLNTLFNDIGFKDKDFHKTYPTIWHLRDKLANDEIKNPDIRLYFLAIQHILKHRGHFLIEGKLENNVNNFKELYADFANAANAAGFTILDSDNIGIVNKVESILVDKTTDKLTKKKEIKEAFFDEDLYTINEDNGTEDNKDHKELAGLLIGSKTNLIKLFGIESEDEKTSISFAEKSFEDLYPDIESKITDDGYLQVILAAKNLYDYIVLKNLLGDSRSISEAMIKNYNTHKKDLKILKQLLKPFPDDYMYFFGAKCGRNCKSYEVDLKGKKPNYPAYIGKAYTGTSKKGGRKTSGSCSQEDVNGYIKTLLEKNNIYKKGSFDNIPVDVFNSNGEKADFLLRLENNELLPKQRGQAKGTIPQQLHHNELLKILENLEKHFPYFAQIDTSAPENYNTISKKIASIHDFRRPYFCGPLVSSDKSEYSWADDEINEIVYPWNFHKLAGLDKRAEKFISSMTNECTYLKGENVLPKSSLIYQKYMVLNEINNLKINGNRINDHRIKMRIYEDFFLAGIYSGNISAKRIERWMKDNKIIEEDDILGGTAEHKFFPKLSTHKDFVKIIGKDYCKQYTLEQLEEVVKAITILCNDRKMLVKKISDILDLNNLDKSSLEIAEKLSKLPYKDWGKFSSKFLTGIKAKVGSRELSILQALEDTENNLMELLSKNNFEYQNLIDIYNSAKVPKNHKITYRDVDALYCSPAVKRSIWQAVKIVKELVKVKGEAPARIFIESTRENEIDKKVPLSRKKKLEEKYAAINNPEAKELLKIIKGEDDVKKFQQNKLYLYFSQMSRCAYCNKMIHLEDLATSAYDIDHIYPQSLTKDDSIEKNKVLVCRECNSNKKNWYPINQEIRNAMIGTWTKWRKNGLITEEKFNRLTRGEPLTADELGGFISRQIVETSQSVKAIRDLFETAYPNTKVILTRANQVSDLRRYYGYSENDFNGNTIRQDNPEFIKVRGLNDLHHAKDAYLNIVVGNTMYETFTGDPVKWIRSREGNEKYNYSLNTKRLFRDSEYYEKYKKSEDGTKEKEIVNYPKMKGWNYGESLKIVSSSLKRNDVLITRMSYEQSGQISDLQIVGKTPSSKNDFVDGIMPIKNNERLIKTARYGGYNSALGAYFSLIEYDDKSKKQRKLVQIPITHKNSPKKFIEANYPEAKIIIECIPMRTRIKKDNILATIAGRTGDSVISHPAMQNKIKLESVAYLKRVLSTYNKIAFMNKTKQTYEITDKDKITIEQNIELFKELAGKNKTLYENAPRSEKRLEIASKSQDFEKLSVQDQCTIIAGLVKLLACNAESGDNELKGLYGSVLGLSQLLFNSKITDINFKLIHQSVTGLYEKEIDLNKIN